MKCKHCGAELKLKVWLKEKLSENPTLSQVFAEISKWEEQIVKHDGCCEKYGKSGRLTI